MIVQANSNVKDALWPLKPGYSGSLMKTFVYFQIWVNVEVYLNVVKYYLCRKLFSMTQEDYKLIIGRRDRWSRKEIDMLEAKYGMYELKKMDAIYRRSGHILVNIWRLYYFVSVCSD